jgi:hypothetical protein
MAGVTTRDWAGSLAVVQEEEGASGGLVVFVVRVG